MELPAELEDDLFFADISKQISLLIMDDDDPHDTVALCSSVSVQGLVGWNYQAAAAATAAAVTSPLTYGRRESKGTGVFIPRSSQPRRKQQKHGNLKRQENRRSLANSYNTSYTNACNPRRV